MSVLSTPRLTLRELTPEDAAFILKLVNEPAWLLYIGDRGIRNPADAEAYIRKGPLASYAQHGFGLWLVVRQEDGVAMGICGLIKRDTLPDVDIGFAFLSRFHRQGYAYEAATATLAYGRERLGLKRIIAITAPANAASINLLEKLGLRFEKMHQPTPDSQVKVFAIDY